MHSYQSHFYAELQQKHSILRPSGASMTLKQALNPGCNRVCAVCAMTKVNYRISPFSPYAIKK